MNTDIVISTNHHCQDWWGKTKIKNIVRDLVDCGKLIITITHDMDFVGECSKGDCA